MFKSISLFFCLVEKKKALSNKMDAGTMTYGFLKHQSLVSSILWRQICVLTGKLYRGLKILTEWQDKFLLQEFVKRACC